MVIYEVDTYTCLLLEIMHNFINVILHVKDMYMHIFRTNINTVIYSKKDHHKQSSISKDTFLFLADTPLPPIATPYLLQHDSVTIELMGGVGRVLYLAGNGEAKGLQLSDLAQQRDQPVAVVHPQPPVSETQLHQLAARLETGGGGKGKGACACACVCAC